MSAQRIRASHTTAGAPDLQDAIRQQINLGERDPLTIYRKVESLYGSEWLAAQLVAYRQDIVSEIARHELGASRRASLSAVVRSTGGKVAKREKMLASVFVPGAGWRAFGECNREEVASVIALYRRLEMASRRYGDFYQRVLDLMVEQGAETVKQLRGALPDVPPPALEA